MAPQDPGEVADAAEIGAALRVLLGRTHDVEDALARRLGLGVTDVLALQHLVDRAELGPVDLGHLLRIRSASATALVDRLQSAGHVERVRHPTDGRRVVLSLTDSARREAAAALAPLLARIGAVVAGFSAEERRAIARFLQRAGEAMADFAAEDAPDDGWPVRRRG
jgi:DNA-binding MarR family transcriptional regulator